MQLASSPARCAVRSPLFLEPILFAKEWGGSRLSPYCGSPLPHNRVGECLAISAHPHHDSVVRGGEFDGLTLSKVWNDRRDLFGDAPEERLPLQVKLIDAREHLSVQVHPNETFALVHEADGAKSECWYVLSPSHDRRVLLGHTARTREGFARRAQQGRWSELLRPEPMREGDFFWVPAGTPHCLLAGSLVYEVLQSSDVTYRLYDHDRIGSNGERRDLHVAKAVGATRISRPETPHPVITQHPGVTCTTFIENSIFRVARWDVTSASERPMAAPYLLAGCIAGSGTVNGEPVRQGSHFVIPHSPLVKMSGRFTLIVTAPGAVRPLRLP